MTYTKSLSTDLIAIPGDKNLPFKIVIGNQDASNTLAIPWESLTNGIQVIKHAHKRETLLIEAIRNYIRKSNLFELTESLNDNEITGEEYDAILQTNSEKYTITLRSLQSREDAIHIINLMNKIGYDLRDFSISEVSEMFSVKENDLISNIKSVGF